MTVRIPISNDLDESEIETENTPFTISFMYAVNPRVILYNQLYRQFDR